MNTRGKSEDLLVRDEEIDALLEAWKRDPQDEIDPRKDRPFTQPAIGGRGRFAKPRSLSERAGSPEEATAGFIDRPKTALLRSLQDIEASSLTAAELKDAPWSDSNWPLCQGLIGARYADPERPATQDHATLHAYVTARPLAQIVRDGVQAEVDLLSPAEKYDLLLGYFSAPLTMEMWRLGRIHADRDGKVPSWIGIGHGRAQASFMLPRPRRTVVLPSPSARFTIRFFPSDLKALGSLLWAAGRSWVRRLGGWGDIDPGTWHLAIINQIAVAKRSLIVDGRSALERWHQPVVGYSYSYFNPLTKKVAHTLEHAAAPKDTFEQDQFRQHRVASGVRIVGIVMDITYIAELPPEHNFSDSMDRDRRLTVRYLYDLELDDSGFIVGGAWYTDNGLDSLWTPAPDARPMTSMDQLASGLWHQPHGLPDSWRETGFVAAQNGQPLEKIVSALFNLAK